MEETLLQRYYDKLASNLLVISVVIRTVVATFVQGGYLDNPGYKHPLVLASVVLTFILVIAIAWGIRKGKLWVKILFIGVVGLGLVYLVADINRTGLSAFSPVQIISYVINYLLQAAVIFCSFRYVIAR